MLGTALAGLAVAFVCLLNVSTAAAQRAETEPVDQLQSFFMRGVAAMHVGDYEKALAVFESLHIKTGAPRVKLEWARTAFLAQRYDLAKRLFSELEQSDLPDNVRFNVSLFLADIARSSTAWDYGFSFVRDSNPFAFGKAQTINIFGIPFSYRPEQRAETLNGLNAKVIYGLAPDDKNNLRLIFTGDVTQYEGAENSKGVLGVAFQIKPSADSSTSVRFGYDAHVQRRETLLNQSYVTYEYRANRSVGPVQQIQFDSKYAQNRYPDYAHINGDLVALGLSASSGLTQSIHVGGRVGWEKVDSHTASQSSDTISASLYVKAFVKLMGGHVTVNYMQSKRNFAAPDELFIVDRRDRREVLSVALQPYRLKLRGMYPRLEVGTERLESNVQVNRYSRGFVNATLSRSY
jgi:hypothetical protein